MDRRDPRALGLAREIALAQLREAAADAQLHLGGGLVRERDREHPIDPGLVVARGADEALDQDAGLAGAGARVDEQRPVAAVNCALLLGRQLGHAAPPGSLRQIDGKAQPVPPEQQLGFGWISPSRILRTTLRTVSRASSSASSSSSGDFQSVRKKRSPPPSSSLCALSTTPRARRSSPASGWYTAPIGSSPSRSFTTSAYSGACSLPLSAHLP